MLRGVYSCRFYVAEVSVGFPAADLCDVRVRVTLFGKVCCFPNAKGMCVEVFLVVTRYSQYFMEDVQELGSCDWSAIAIAVCRTGGEFAK